jgi:hypothetical protein
MSSRAAATLGSVRRPHIPLSQLPGGTNAENNQFDASEYLRQRGIMDKTPEWARANASAVFSPETIGARKAKNGFYYAPDPDRPGKYLIVLPKKRQVA